MSKSPEAFRTISEVAEWLDTPAHVLRFWENRFSQIRPIKRAGGRRYYRPTDMQLLGGIRKLLHEDGLTIRGVQKILREQGVKYVIALSPELDLAPPCPPAAPERPMPEPAPPAASAAPAAPKPAAPPDLTAARAWLTPERLAALPAQHRGTLAILAQRLEALARRMDNG